MDNNARPRQDTITREESVLVLIDIQEKLLPVIAQKEIILENVLRLIRFARLLDIPVVVTEQEKLGLTLPEVATEVAGVNPVGKVFFNCFMSEQFKNRINHFAHKTLILAGVEAHICVMQTALHALSSYNVHVIADAIGSRTIENRDIAIERMRQSGATISSTEMFIYEILQRAGTDTFKAALKLVK